MAATARAVDLTNVKEGGSFRPRRKPEGDYLAKVVKADDHQPNDKTKPLGWVLTIQIDGDARSTYPYYLSPEAKQAWKIGGICRAAGLKVKNALVKFDPNKLVGKTIGVALADDEYEGRLKSVVDDVFTKDEVGPNADEDAPADDEDYDTADEVDVPDDDPIEEEEVEEKPEPAPVARKRRPKPVPEPEPEPEDDEEEYEEEEPAPTPPPRKRTARPAAKAVTPPARRVKPAPVVEDDEDDLEGVDLDDLDD